MKTVGAFNLSEMTLLDFMSSKEYLKAAVRLTSPKNLHLAKKILKKNHLVYEESLRLQLFYKGSLNLHKST